MIVAAGIHEIQSTSKEFVARVEVKNDRQTIKPRIKLDNEKFLSSQSTFGPRFIIANVINFQKSVNHDRDILGVNRHI